MMERMERDGMGKGEPGNREESSRLQNDVYSLSTGLIVGSSQLGFGQICNG